MRPPAFDVEAELGGDGDLVADGRERFSDKLFVRVRAVDLGRIEERDALFVGGTNDLDALVPVGRRSVVGADAHAPGADFRDLQLPSFRVFIGACHRRLRWRSVRCSPGAALLVQPKPMRR